MLWSVVSHQIHSYVDGIWKVIRFIWSHEGRGDTGDVGLIPGSGRSPAGRNGNPLQYSCLENPMDRGAWWATRVRHDWSDLAHRDAQPPLAFLSHLRGWKMTEECLWRSQLRGTGSLKDWHLITGYTTLPSSYTLCPHLQQVLSPDTSCLINK